MSFRQTSRRRRVIEPAYGDYLFLPDAEPVSRVDRLLKLLPGNLRHVLASAWPFTPLLILTPLVATALWLASIDDIDLRAMTDLGLVTVLPARFYLALVVVVLSTTAIIHARRIPEIFLYLHIALFILIIHGTPAIAYGTLRYAWAWKHVGIVDYIQRTGAVNPTIPVLDVYHNWPGFFSLSATLTEVAGLPDALSFAIWAPVIFNLIDLGALVLIFRSFTGDRRLSGLGLWIFYLANWVGQDYFSPQALNYFLHLVVIGIVLRWFRTNPESFARSARAAGGRLQTALNTVYRRAALTELPAAEISRVRRAGLMLILLLLIAVIATTHQITPIMTTVMLGLLAIFRRISARSLPFVALILMIGWGGYVAAPFVSDNLSDVYETLGAPAENVDESLIDLAQVSPGQKIVSGLARGLTGVILAVGFAGGLTRLNAGRWDLAAGLLAIGPLLIIGGSAYGGEILFRVYFFALPFLAFFAAAIIYPDEDSGGSPLSLVMSGVLSLALLVGLLFAYYGKEQQYYFTRDEIEAARFIYETAPPGSLLIEGSRNYPTQFLNYERFTYVPISREPQPFRLRLVETPVETLSRWMSNDEFTATYLLITHSQKVETDQLGALPVGALDNIETALRQSPLFTTVFENEDAVVFILTDALR